jgi:hypothetical protein
VHTKKIDSVLLSKKFERSIETCFQIIAQEKDPLTKAKWLSFLKEDYIFLYFNPKVHLGRAQIQDISQNKQVAIYVDDSDVPQMECLLNDIQLKKITSNLICDKDIFNITGWNRIPLEEIKKYQFDMIFVYSLLFQEIYIWKLINKGISQRNIFPLFTTKILLSDGYTLLSPEETCDVAILCDIADQNYAIFREKFPGRVSLFCNKCIDFNLLHKTFDNILFFSYFIELLIKLHKSRAKLLVLPDNFRKFENIFRDLLDIEVISVKN